MPSPEQIFAELRESNLSLSQLRSSLPDDLRRPSEWRSWLTLARIGLCSGVCLGALSQVRPELESMQWWHPPVIAFIWLIYGLVLLGIFVIGHDAGHRSFSRYSIVNNVVGFFCMSAMFNGFHTWKLTHNHHHGHTQLRGQEVDWSANLVTPEEFAAKTWRSDFITRLGYALPFGLLVWIAVNTFRRALNVGQMLGPERYQREKRRILFSNLVMGVIYLSVYGGFWLLTDFWGMFYYHGVPLFIAFMVGALVITLGHANRDSLIFEPPSWSSVAGQIAATQDIRFYRWVEWLILDINIHVPHHVDTRIPWYHLRRSRELLKGNYPQFYREERLSLGHISGFMRTPFLRREHDFLQIDGSLSAQ